MNRYTVTLSALVASQFEQLLDDAERVGFRPAALAAYEAAVDQLENDPIGYGEAREVLPAMGVRTRIAFEAPLVIRFGVHEQARIVWIQQIRLRIPGRR